MNGLTYSITIREDITDEQFNIVTQKLTEYFSQNDFTVKSVSRKKGSTVIEFILENWEYIAGVAGFSFFVAKRLLGNILDDVYNHHIKDRLFKKGLPIENKPDNQMTGYNDQMIACVVKELAKNPGIINKTSKEAIRNNFQNEILAIGSINGHLKKIEISYLPLDIEEELRFVLKDNPKSKTAGIELYLKGEVNYSDELSIGKDDEPSDKIPMLK